VQVPIITGDPVADWVAETDDQADLAADAVEQDDQAYTLAVIVPFSNQFRRDLGGLYSDRAAPPARAREEVRPDRVRARGRAPGSDFDTLGAATEVGIAGKTFAGLVAAQTAIATYGPQDGDLNGWVLSPAGRAC
jgi:hypothetical protein